MNITIANKENIRIALGMSGVMSKAMSIATPDRENKSAVKTETVKCRKIVLFILLAIIPV